MTKIMKARKIFEVRCMNKLGFSGNTFYGLTYDSFDETAKSRHLRPLTVRQARHHGYHTASDTAAPLSEPSTTPTPPVPASALHLQIAAMFGKVARVHSRAVPSGGCNAQSERDLERGAPTQLPVDPRVLSDQAQAQADQAASVTAAVSDWSACMEHAGYSYNTPQDAVSDAAGTPYMDGRFHTNPNAKEIATATADAHCRATTGLYEKWSAAVTHFEEAAIAHNRTQLRRAQAITKIWITNARAAVQAHDRH
ncbi:hypothetical protein GQF42_02565 [Streptomyces broussonetiae]|uniref:Uncharacterized protein n=2 Tax=Streptomyces broussonetiae TaxID=2686304 RepID=A0A6I6MTK0_9ACTN|nr:hypothetical protein [Streptomyces broussonetiae]QHA02334.1 hypothetical protein GQF42_02565 [Streptomyces broussonetiae]